MPKFYVHVVTTYDYESDDIEAEDAEEAESIALEEAENEISGGWTFPERDIDIEELKEKDA